VAVREEVHRALSAILKRKGYRVVDPATVETIEREHARPLGQVFDPITGKADPQRWDAVWKATKETLSSRHGVDALLCPELLQGELKAYTESLWKGTKYAAGEPLVWNGRALKMAPDRVEGVYLSILIEDRAAAELYDALTPLAWTAIYRERARQARPSNEAIRAEQINSAVTSALDPLVDARPTP